MNSTEFLPWLTQLEQYSKVSRHRRLVILAGSNVWAYKLISHIPSYQKVIDEKKWFIFTNKAIQNGIENNREQLPKHRYINNKNYRESLGSECQYIVFDDPQLNIDKFAALSGTLAAGGILFLFWPEPIESSALIKNSLFLQRFFRLANGDKGISIVKQNTAEQRKTKSLHQPLPFLENKETKSPLFPLYCKTAEQLQAVEAIKKVFSGHRDRPLVLTADRGRGKSSALAIACADLIEHAQLGLNIIISAPHSQALTIFFKQLVFSLPNATFDHLSLTYIHNNLPNKPSSQLTFLPIDLLLKDKPSASLLLIDEAAAIPVYLLEQVNTQYHRVIFSTTVHGYEGAGRGFSLKFQQILALHKPQWQALHISEPIRWSVEDPLEKFVFDSCLLDAKLTELKSNDVPINSLTFTCYSKQELLENEDKLAQLFSLLVTAHYQTSAGDLRLILDSELVDVVSLVKGEQIVAVALLMHEGECEQQTISGIQQGQRRLKNQFLPQSLINHCGFEQAFNYRYLRVMRIAVHPDLQQQGIGSYFLSKILTYAKQQTKDFLGTSFGANKQLLRYWLAADFKLVRIGFTKDQASGEHSALLLKSLTSKGRGVQNTLNTEFYRCFGYLLNEQYQYLSADLVASILNSATAEQLPKLTEVDCKNIDAFINKKRLYNSCVFSLHLWLQQHLSTSLLFNNVQVHILISRILQKQSIAEVCQQFQLSGKKALNQCLIDYVNRHYYYLQTISDTETS